MITSVDINKRPFVSLTCVRFNVSLARYVSTMTEFNSSMIVRLIVE